MKKLSKISFLLFLPFCIAFLYLLPGSFNELVLKAEISFYQWILPAEPLSDDIVIITIGDEDVRLLDGWPISRDYYSYAIYAANLSGAKAIGLDIFFSGPDKRYPRYDSTMADFLASSGNVVLPMFFSELKYEKAKMISIDPHYSIPIISLAAATNGFSNLGSDAVIYQLP